MRSPVLRRTLGDAAALAVAALMLVGTATAAQGEVERPIELGNDPTRADVTGIELLRQENVSLQRFDDRIEIEIALEAPTPGTYRYPDSVDPSRRASPEVFTVWVFVFNEPSACTSSAEPPFCGGDDFTESAKGGVFNLAGHITSIDHDGGAFVINRDSGGMVVMRGEIEAGDPPRSDLPPAEDTPRFTLSDPLGAEVHVAIAPHGQLDPATLPDELFNPAGNPTCGCWWVAIFAP